MDFPQAAIAVGEIPEAKRNRNRVAERVRQGERKAVTLAERDVAVGADTVGSFLDFGRVEHGLAEVHAEDRRLRGEAAGQGEGDITTPGGKVQHRAGRPTADRGDELAPPPQVKSATQESVGDVVAGRDAREHGIDRDGIGHS